MKRNDMIKLIYDSFKNAEAGDSLESAEYVLEQIEDAGMLPPAYQGTEIRHNLCCEVKQSVNINKWED